MAIYNGIVVSGGESLQIESGDIASRTIVSDGGLMKVDRDGSATGTYVNAGGAMDVDSGGAATSTYVNAGGKINGFTLLADNFYSSDIHISKAIVDTEATLHNGTASDITVYYGGCMNVDYNGSATSTYVYAGGKINGFTLLADNFYSSGIHISKAIVDTEATLRNREQTASDITVYSGGCMNISLGGAATSTTIYSGGSMNVNFGAATSTYVYAGGKINGFTLLADNFYSSGIHISKAIVDTEATLGDSQTASDITVYYGGFMDVWDNGAATSTTIYSGGSMYVGGAATNTTIYSGGKMYVNNTANCTTVNSGGYMNVDYRGTTISTYINAGGTINGFILLADNFYSSGIHISKAIVDTKATLHNREQTASDITVYYDGKMYVDGAATSTTINSGGYMDVWDNGAATSTTVYAGGSMEVDGGAATSTTINSGGKINGFTLLADNFYSSGIHISKAIVDTEARLRGNQTASDITVYYGGNMFVYNNCIANNTTVNSGGFMEVRSGTANNTTVNSGGFMYIYEGYASGLMVMAGGSVSFVYGFLDLNLEKRAGTSDYLIAGTLTGTPNYTITVSETQTAGTYQLIKEMPKFIENITLCTSQGDIGTLVTNGASVTYKENQYSLVSDGSDLSLVVSGPYAPQGDMVAPTSPGNLSVTVNADSAEIRWTQAVDNVAVTGYRIVLDNGSAIDVGNVLSYTIQNPAPGNHSVQVGAYDAAGNLGTYNGVTFLVKTADPGVDPAPNPDPGVDPAPNPDPGVDPTPKPEPGQPAAPDGTTVTVKKYNATFSWNKYPAAKGVKVKYQIMVDDDADGKLSSGTKYTFKNAAVGSHSFSVRAVLSEKGKEDVYTAWSGNLTQYVADVTAPKTGKLSLVQTGEDSVKLNWTAANDNVGVSRYIVTCGNETRELGGGIFETEFHGKAGKVAASIIAYDEAGNAGKTVKKTLSMKDRTAPTQVSGLRSEGVDNKSGGVLAWDPSSDNVGVTQYLIAIEGGKTCKSKTNSVRIKKMAAGTYRYTVIALDKAKNQSIVSTAGEFTVADVICPKIKKLSSKVTDQSAAVTWNATDEVGIVRSELWCDDQRFDTTGLSSWNLSGLESGRHTLRLNVWDAAGNMSVKMANCNVKTLAQTASSAGMLAAI